MAQCSLGEHVIVLVVKRGIVPKHRVKVTDSRLLRCLAFVLQWELVQGKRSTLTISDLMFILCHSVRLYIAS